MYEYQIILVRVIDGDTIVADVDLGFNQWSHDQHLRLAGINAPEMRQPGGKEAREWLVTVTDGKALRIRTDKDRTGSFGRYLATLYVGRKNINKAMVKAGYAEPWK